jgi:hypothetical protein
MARFREATGQVVDSSVRVSQASGAGETQNPAMPGHAPGPEAPFPERTTIDSTFRNGSLTAMGVVVAFSLGFLSRWAGLPGSWTGSDIFAVAAITLGVSLQVKALVDMLSVRSLIVVRYNRTVRVFLGGLILVTAGIAAAIFADLVGLGGIALRG